MVAMAHMTGEIAPTRPVNRLQDKDWGYCGTVKTQAGIVVVTAYKPNKYANGIMVLEFSIAGYDYRWRYEHQYYTKRYAVTLARRMSEAMALRNSM